MTTLPIPRDLPLPLPVSRQVLEVLLVGFFILHILFVNLMVGGSVLALGFEIFGLRRPGARSIAKAIGRTITVNKSLAVVLGVGPLLAMNLLHTVHFYTANALTGTAWALVIPLVTVAFLLTYAHKYSWQRLAAYPRSHLAVGAVATGFFLVIPLIFLVNANLMLFPERWTSVQGFLQALQLPNVLPRYGHFLLSSLAVTCLFLAGWMGRPGFPVEDSLPGWSRPQLRRMFYRGTLWVSLAQFLMGPWVYLSLPRPGVTPRLIAAILGGVAFAIAAILLLRQEINAPDTETGRRFWPIAGFLSATVLLMATGRHFYREDRLQPHQVLIESATRDYQEAARAARMNSQDSSSSPQNP